VKDSLQIDAEKCKSTIIIIIIIIIIIVQMAQSVYLISNKKYHLSPP